MNIRSTVRNVLLFGLVVFFIAGCNEEFKPTNKSDASNVEEQALMGALGAGKGCTKLRTLDEVRSNAPCK